MKQQTEQSAAATSVKDRVFSTIQEEKVCPRSKYVFLCQNWLVWGLWAGSIIFGALSLAVLLFVSTHRYYDIYEATHENFVTFLLDALPYVWIAVFAGMLWLAMWQLKNTKRGYRLSATILGVSSFAFSVILGGLFHVGGFGWSLDRWLGETAPMYVSQAKMEQKMWQNPAEGRLLGQQLLDVERSSTTVLFTDIAENRWSVVIADLSAADMLYLAKGERVRLLGVSSSTNQALFHACGVFPWMLDQPTKMAAISEERKQFVDRMYGHYEDAEARKKALEAVTAENTQSIAKDSPCHTLAAVRRVHEQMH